MAQSPDRFEKGVGNPRGTGEFFVSESCIDCDLCRQMAPDIFKRKFTGTGGMSFVTRQPANEFESSKATEALEACPVNAIQRAAAAEAVPA